MDKGPWAHANKVQLWDAQGEGAMLNCLLEGNSRKGLVLGKHKMGVQELELRV